MSNQKCTIGCPAHSAIINDLPAKLGTGLGQKLRRERQVLQALGRIRSRGTKNATVCDLVTEIYGISLDVETRGLALQPFVGEVLKKLAVDGYSCL